MSSPLLTLIEENNWGKFQPMMDELAHWEYWPLFLEKLRNLNWDALYESPVHGPGHIERTMLHGAFCAMTEPFCQTGTELLLECCAYHDTGRINDWVDDEHGFRAARKLEALTGRTGEELQMMKAAVDAHSRSEAMLLPTLAKYGLADEPRALALAQLLKDSDGLDRVRIWDLNVHYLRREESKKREDFAQYLFERYQQAAGDELIFSSASPKAKEMLRSHHEMWQKKRGRR